MIHMSLKEAWRRLSWRILGSELDSAFSQLLKPRHKQAIFKQLQISILPASKAVDELPYFKPESEYSAFAVAKIRRLLCQLTQTGAKESFFIVK